MLAFDNTQIVLIQYAHDTGINLLVIHGHRVSDIDSQLSSLLVQLYHSHIEHKLSGRFVFKSTAHLFSMESVSYAVVVETDKVVGIFTGEVESAQEFHQHSDSVLSLFRLSTVSRHALHCDFKALTDALTVYLASLFTSKSCHLLLYMFVACTCTFVEHCSGVICY